jgi:glutamine amidotransferase-like uncharacterized protein
MKTIAIYQDYVHNNGSLAMALQDLGYNFHFIDADAIIHNKLNADALVMPGGADLYYCEKLNGLGNQKIKRFVENGGGYLGICAGAYYGCAGIDWNDGEIAGPRELSFIDAHAVGPVRDFVPDLDQSWYAPVNLHTDMGVFKTLYAAGPVFDVKDAEILATYDNNRPAIIAKGSVVLSSPHIECFGNFFANGRYTHNTKHAAHEEAVAVDLLPHQAKQKKFFTFILERIISRS